MDDKRGRTDYTGGMTNERSGIIGSFPRLALNNAAFTETRRVKTYHSPMDAAHNAKKQTLAPLDAPRVHLGHNRVTSGTPRPKTI